MYAKLKPIERNAMSKDISINKDNNSNQIKQQLETMKKTYQKPEAWVEEILYEGSIANQIVSNVDAKGANGEDLGISLGGASSEEARTVSSILWDDEEGDAE